MWLVVLMSTIMITDVAVVALVIVLVFMVQFDVMRLRVQCMFGLWHGTRAHTARTIREETQEEALECEATGKAPSKELRMKLGQAGAADWCGGASVTVWCEPCSGAASAICAATVAEGDANRLVCVCVCVMSEGV